MRRDPTNRPFDLEADDQRDVTSEFWGGTRGWDSREHEVVVDSADRRDDTTGSLRAIRDGLAAFRPKVRSDASGEIERTRQHGAVRPQPVADDREATLAELASEWFDDDDDWPMPATAQITAATHGDASDDRHESDTRRPAAVTAADDHDLIPLAGPAERPSLLGGVDPLLLRVGAVVTALVLLVPLALSLRPDDAGAIQTNSEIGTPVGAAPAPAEGENEAPATEAAPAESAPDVEPAPAAVAADSNDATEAAPVAEQPSASAGATDEPEAAPADGSSDASGNAEVAALAETTDSETAAAGSEGIADAATVDEAAEREVPECPQVYTAGPGDSWYRIADAAGVTPSALLAENRATIDTVIFPGDEICLPAGATMPEPPSTTAPPTTAPATTAPPTTPPPTTAPPTTTPASTGEVQQIIRDVWPDELEEKALQIAFRESRYIATAYNGWCCYGVFQIYWTVHQGWLDDFGIYTSSDLYDARKNTEAAYEIYRRAGGWGPWGG